MSLSLPILLISRFLRFWRKHLTIVFVFVVLFLIILKANHDCNSKLEDLQARNEFFKSKETQALDPRLQLYSILVHEHGLPVFFVDPFILLSLLPSSARAWISQDPFVGDLCNKYDSLYAAPTTLYAGVAANDTKNMTLPKLLNEIVNIAVANNFSSVNVSRSSGASETPNHVVLTKVVKDGFALVTLTLHILVFHTVKNSTIFWTAAYAPENTVQQPTLNIPMGKRPTIFDEFGLQKEIVPWMPSSPGGKPMHILVPSDPQHFIQQIPHATHVQCNLTHAEEYRLKYANFSNASQVTADAVHRFTLEQTKSMFKTTHIPFWACCGTLLGWYRECGAVRYTTDADYCTFGPFSASADTIVTDLLELVKSSNQLDMMWTMGLPSLAFEMAFSTKKEPVSKKNFQWDINFVYPTPDIANFNDKTSLNGDGWVMSIHRVDDHAFQYQHMPRVTEFCSTVLWGLKVQVPCDPLPDILNFYGDEKWKSPINAGFSYGNILSQYIYWNESDYSKAYVIYRNLRKQN